jgi:hypothetical protein
MKMILPRLRLSSEGSSKNFKTLLLIEEEYSRFSGREVVKKT